MISNESNTTAIVISNFTDTPNIRRLLELLKDHNVQICCYNCDKDMGYPVFFMNYILNTYCNYIACDDLAAKKLDRFKRKYKFIDINNIKAEEISID